MELLVVRALSQPVPLRLSPILEPAELPHFITAVQAQAIACHYFGPTASISIRDTWGLVWREFSGRYVTSSRDFIAEAKRRFDAAPVHRRGKERTRAAATAESQA